MNQDITSCVLKCKFKQFQFGNFINHIGIHICKITKTNNILFIKFANYNNSDYICIIKYLAISFF